MRLPHFKYNPNAYQLDIFIEEEGTCSVCHEKRSLKYNSSLYCVDNPEYICPFCIANGKASEKYNGEFNDCYSIEGIPFDPEKEIQELSDIPKEMLEEISKRTPSYHSWQQEVWLIHCNEPCIFLGYGSSENLIPILDEIKEDIEELGISQENFIKELKNNCGLGTYLFQCNCCGKHRLHIDFD